MEKGELFVEPGLLSASALYPLPHSYQNMNTHFAIRSMSGRLIQAFSNRKEEWEVLFAAGTSFRILSFEDTEPGGSHESWGRYKIVMEEVEKPKSSSPIYLISGLTEYNRRSFSMFTEASSRTSTAPPPSFGGERLLGSQLL